MEKFKTQENDSNKKTNEINKQLEMHTVTTMSKQPDLVMM